MPFASDRYRAVARLKKRLVAFAPDQPLSLSFLLVKNAALRKNWSSSSVSLSGSSVARWNSATRPFHNGMETTRFFGDLHHADRLARKDDAGGRRSLMQRNRVQWVAIITFGARNEASIERPNAARDTRKPAASARN